MSASSIPSFSTAAATTSPVGTVHSTASGLNPLPSAQAAIASSNSSEASTSSSSARQITPLPGLSPYRELLNSVCADGRAYFGNWIAKSPNNPVLAKPTLAGWEGFSSTREDCLRAGLEGAVKAVFDNFERNNAFSRIEGTPLAAWADIHEAFPNGKLPPNTMQLRAEAITTAISPFLLRISGLIDMVLGYSQGLIVQAKSHQGSRPSQEDFLFVSPERRLWGVFDGHSGWETSWEARRDFPQAFTENLTKTNGNPLLALQLAAYEVARATQNDKSASVGAVVHIDESFSAHLLAIGDCVVHIYRKINGKTKCIQVAYVNDWSSVTEKERARLADAPIVQTKPTCPLPCNLKSPDEIEGVTNSRELGESPFQYFDGQPLVISKPEVSFYPFLQPGDRVLIMSDGVEFLRRTRIAQMIDEGVANLADAITKEAAAAHPRSDNVTVIAIHVDG